MLPIGQKLPTSNVSIGSIDRPFKILKMSTIPSFAETHAEKLSCFPVIHQLRPHLKDEKDFISRLERMEKTNQYRLLYIKDNGVVVAVAGLRFMEKLFGGKLIYVDDLATHDSVRSRGYGRILLDFLKEYVKDNNLDGLTLDSGVQRSGAHKFYFANNFSITAYHFTAKL